MTDISVNQIKWLAEIESDLIFTYMPFYLSIDLIDGFEEELPTIHIFIGSSRFDHYSVNERISKIFQLLNETDPDIIKNNTVVIETYNSKEFEGLIDNWFI